MRMRIRLEIMLYQPFFLGRKFAGKHNTTRAAAFFVFVHVMNFSIGRMEISCIYMHIVHSTNSRTN